MHTSTRPTAAQTRVIAAYRTCEFATVTRGGTPIAWPIVSWQRPDGAFVVTTSIGLPQKAFNVRRNPAVAMLFSDPTASGLIDPPQILVQGMADCPDEIVGDVSTLPDYWLKLMSRQPSSKSLSSAVGRRLMDFYYQRLIISVTATEVTERRAVTAAAPLVAPPPVGAGRHTPIGQVATRLPDYRSGVLAAFDDSGRPTLHRVRPLIEHGALRIDAPAEGGPRPGPASLLCHSHDDQLSAQRSFVVAGQLQRQGGGWVLTTERFIPGPGTGGPLEMVKAVHGMRTTARRYLQRRGLPRPAVRWAAIDELWRQVESAG